MSETDHNKKPDHWADDLKKLNIVMYFGFTVIANIFVAGLIGFFIDLWTFDNKMIWILFLFLGVASGLYHGIKGLMHEATRIEKIEKQKRDHKESR